MVKNDALRDDYEDEPTKKKRSVAPPEIKEGFKPIAGSTTAYVKQNSSFVDSSKVCD